MRSCLAYLTVLGCLFVLVSPAMAAPLVDGDLVLYYDFDEDWEAAGVVSDQSNNNNTYDAEVIGRIYRSDASVRGDGAALFDSGGYYLPDVDPETIDITWFPDDFLQLGSTDPSNVGPPPADDWGPAFTVSVWVNAKRYGSLSTPPNNDPMALFGIRSDTGAWVSHFQLENNGRLRGQLRNNFGEDIASPNVFLNGDPSSGPGWPEEEWFMYSQTYDSNATFGGLPGHWVQYANGQKINEGYAQEEAESSLDLGGWGMAFNIGRDMDEDRQFHGYMDEYYLFTRALSPEEIETLYDLDGCEYDRGDVNQDGAINGLDVGPFVTLVADGTYQCEGDVNEDGAVNGLDVAGFVDLVVGGGAAAVPEPSAIILASLGLLGLVWYGRRRR